MRIKYANHPLYSTWRNMKQRCYSPTYPRYADYGGRGIKICRRWRYHKGFLRFVEDMGERPEGYVLDRIDNNKGYFPENCHWTDRSSSQFNRRKPRPYKQKVLA